MAFTSFAKPIAARRRVWPVATAHVKSEQPLQVAAVGPIAISADVYRRVTPANGDAPAFRHVMRAIRFALPIAEIMGEVEARR